MALQPPYAARRLDDAVETLTTGRSKNAEAYGRPASAGYTARWFERTLAMSRATI